MVSLLRSKIAMAFEGLCFSDQSIGDIMVHREVL